MAKILVVDDERNVRGAFEDVLATKGHDVVAVDAAEDALRHLEAEDCDLVILDVCLPGLSGLDALARIRQLRAHLPVIVMTGRGTTDTAIEATKRGAFEYLLKPFEPAEMLQIVAKALESARLMKGRIALGPEAAPATAEAIIGCSAAMQEVYKAIGRVAQTDATVLIRGESGTGKELIARAIHQHSRRCDRPLVIVNCVAIPETLLESELFGYEKGAFTGASSRRIGKFEQADGATVLLDEIGDLPLALQAKILRVLQEKTFQRLGGNETMRADVRMLAATNRDLEAATAKGAFREDLYYRLNVVTIRVPPLRQRPEDIPRLVDYFLGRFAWELKIDKPTLAPDARKRLEQHLWQGNVRELEHCIQRTMIFTRGHAIQAADLLLAPNDALSEPEKREVGDEDLTRLISRYLSTFSGQAPLEQFLERAERIFLAEALRRTRGNQTHAARLLGLPRPTLHAKLRKHGLHEADASGEQC